MGLYVIEKSECKHCHIILENLKNIDIANHQRWCNKNPKRFDSYANCGAGISKAGQLRKLTRCGVEKEYKVICFKCQKYFSVIEGEKVFPLKEKYFCSTRCANSKDHSTETRKKIAEGLKNSDKIKRKPIAYKKCMGCDETVSNRRKFCSDVCFKNSKVNNRDKRQQYRMDCQFQFALSDYPDKFDFNLITEHGWYHPSTHKTPNLNGISRDHIVSINYGFKNNIDPAIIRHPANCGLLRHNDNIAKNFRCGMTVEELLEKIKFYPTSHTRQLEPKCCVGINENVNLS